MREFFLPLRKHIAAGLRPHREAPPDAPGLVLAENLRPAIGGLAPAYAPVDPGVDGAVFPYPQLFPSWHGPLLATARAWYAWDGQTAAGLLTGLDAGEPWALADLAKYKLATNGAVKIRRDPPTGNWMLDDNADIPAAGVFAAFNGQILAGDIPAAWKYDAAPNMAAWSEIGAASFDLSIKNTAGYMPMPWSGRILAMKKLGRQVMVYGEGGVSRLVPVTAPAPSFGLGETPFSGVAGRLAVCGDDSVHFLVDSAGELWRFSANHEASLLGFKEFFAPLAAAGGVTLHYNKQSQDVIISGADRHFTYSDRTKALAGPAMRPITGAVFDQGLFLPVGPASTAPDRATLVTDLVDMQKGAIKSLEWVELDGYGLQGVEAAVDYRYTSSAPWVRSPWVPAGPEHIARIGVAGTEFRICVRCDLAQGLVISGINLRWKANDRRYTRGSEAINWGQGNAGA